MIVLSACWVCFHMARPTEMSEDMQVASASTSWHVLLQDAGFQQAFEPIRVKFKPTAKDMQVAEESGTGASPGHCTASHPRLPEWTSSAILVTTYLCAAPWWLQGLHVS